MVRGSRTFSVLCVALLAGVVLSGCATKKYVREQVQTVQPQIQEAQNAAKENAERIDSVDKRAQQGISTAQSAAQAADQKAVQAQQDAQTAHSAAQLADRKAETANESVQQAGNRINTLDTKINSINDNYAQSDMLAVVFPLNSAMLTEQARSTLDRIAGDLSGQRSGYMIEVQGYTDNTGTEQYNIGLSQRRAESVERYLVSKNVPLYRVSIVGLGKDNPIADNKTSQGRAQNRRVEVRVLKSTNNNRQTN
ncbi:MAG: flagellar motor protein MotB [Acidobacteria bacterium]|nr:MAG: flagellar motor protein MotB [Acidobacteriota bacterium]PYS16087.1 MAG: flagellar motor protein MotB [Acidobacteriota bacterium]